MPSGESKIVGLRSSADRSFYNVHAWTEKRFEAPWGIGEHLQFTLNSRLIWLNESRLEAAEWANAHRSATDPVRLISSDFSIRIGSV